MFRIIRLVNEGDVPFVGKFNSQEYRVAARSETLVPFEAMCLWMGNPEARDIDSRRRDRVEEYNRLRVKYGAYENDELWDANRPRLKAFDAATGERIWTVMDDPDGTKGGTGLIVPGQANVEQMQRAMEAMQQQMQLMAAMMQSQQAGTPDATGEADDDTDTDADVADAPPVVTPTVKPGPVPTPGAVSPDEVAVLAASVPEPTPAPGAPAATPDTPQRPKTGKSQSTSGGLKVSR